MSRSSAFSGCVLIVASCAFAACATHNENSVGDAGPSFVGDSGTATSAGPATCEQAAAKRSYLGCDFWPTVVANLVSPMFDYTVVVANVGAEAADVAVTGPNGVNTTTTVAPHDLAKIYLPWVDALKVLAPSSCASPVLGSTIATKSAYHLVSSKPVSVYQFSPLEYKSFGGPANKVWSEGCGGSQGSETSGVDCTGGKCMSFSNDASLLLPSTAMTGDYRVAGQVGQYYGPYFAITGTQDGTSVTVSVGSRGKIVAGDGVTATTAHGTLTLSLEAGDVAELFGDDGDDLSGSLVKATKPVQVITGHPCLAAPTKTTPFCDHVEESLLPAEALGRDYFVAMPTGPNSNAVGHLVRIYGNVDGTTLTYAPAPPPGAPSTLNAGDVIDLGTVTSDFEVKGDHEFVVGTLMLSSTLVDPSPYPKGDPSQSFAIPVEQYRDDYVFLSPDDYDVSFVDVTAPAGAVLTLDGAPTTAVPTPIANGYVVHRISLGGGVHELSSTLPVGIQVMGYGNATSYQYPGGSDFAPIAPAPN